MGQMNHSSHSPSEDTHVCCCCCCLAQRALLLLLPPRLLLLWETLSDFVNPSTCCTCQQRHAVPRAAKMRIFSGLCRSDCSKRNQKSGFRVKISHKSGWFIKRPFGGGVFFFISAGL